jgi:hypothetical protein
MSWFKRSPRKNEPYKPPTIPHHTSPASDKMMEEAKKIGPARPKKEKTK